MAQQQYCLCFLLCFSRGGLADRYMLLLNAKKKKKTEEEVTVLKREGSIQTVY